MSIPTRVQVPDVGTSDEILAFVQARSRETSGPHFHVITYGDSPLRFFWSNDAWYVQGHHTSALLAQPSALRMLRNSIRYGWYFILVQDKTIVGADPYLLCCGKGEASATDRSLRGTRLVLAVLIALFFAGILAAGTSLDHAGMLAVEFPLTLGIITASTLARTLLRRIREKNHV